MEKNLEPKWVILGIAVVVAGAVLIPIILKKVTKKAYKQGSKVTEEDFINNGPEIVRKAEDDANDD